MATPPVYLIRHGATNLTAEDRFSGGTEVDLSEEGRWQVECLADDKIRAVYCSPMRWTVETAAIICQPYPFHPHPRVGLREINHGRWETMSRAEVEARYAGEYAAWQEDPFTFAPQGGESGVEPLYQLLGLMTHRPNGDEWPWDLK
jgi:broad specificity phosphatase PhoE